MAGKMTSSECRSKFAGAGAPPEAADLAEAKGLDLNSVWTLWQTISTTIADPGKTTSQKAWAVVLAVLAFLPSVVTPPAPTPSPVVPGKPS